MKFRVNQKIRFSHEIGKCWGHCNVAGVDIPHGIYRIETIEDSKRFWIHVEGHIGYGIVNTTCATPLTNYYTYLI